MTSVQHSTNGARPPATVDVPLAAPKPAWLRWCVWALVVAVLVTVAAPLLLPEAAQDHPRLAAAFGWANRIIAAVLGVVLLAWIVTAQREIVAARTRARLWEQSIESMNVGVALWDADDRLIGCNDAYRDLYSEIAAELVPGCSYRELMSVYHAVAPPEVVDGRTLTDFIADGERRRRSGSEVSEVVRHHRGRWLLMTDCRTANGGIICFRNDVTEQKVIEHELTKRRKLIDDLADLTYDWFWRQDAEGRFVEFSAAMEAARQGGARRPARTAARGHAGLRGRSEPVRRVPRAARAAAAVSLVHLSGATRRRHARCGSR